MQKRPPKKIGELSTRHIIDIYYNNVLTVNGPFKFIDFVKLENNRIKLQFKYNDKEFNIEATGNGPIDSCIKAVKQAGFNCEFLNYEQKALNMGSDAVGMTIMYFKAPNGTTIISRGCDENTFMANIKAIFNGLNIIESK